MSPAFLSVYEKLERQRIKLMELLRDVPEENLHTSAPGKWSIAQILIHVLTAEKLSIGYMRKKALGIETLANSGIKHTILLNVLKISQRIPVRYKAPKVIVQHTPEALSYQEFIQQWGESRGELKNFLESIDDKHTKRLVFKHPVTGRMNATQSIEFMIEHINHHLPQIRKVLKS